MAQDNTEPQKEEKKEECMTEKEKAKLDSDTMAKLWANKKNISNKGCVRR